MATTNVGNLHVKLMMTDRQFQSASQRVRSTNRQTERSFDRLRTGGMRRMNAGFLELSRGVEDFAVSASTGGFAAGMRGAGNNISQFASMIHPLAGVLAGLTVAGVTAFASMKKGTSAAKKEVNLLSSSLVALGDRMDEIRSKEEFLSQLGVASGKMTAREGLQKRIDSERKRAERFRKDERDSAKLIEDAKRDFQRTVGGDPESDDPFDAPLDPNSPAYRNAEQERDRRIANARRRRDAASDARKKSEKRLEQLEREGKISDAEERQRGFREESEGIQEGKKKSFEERQERIRERNRKKEEFAKKQERERKKLEDRRESLMERRADIEERMKERRRITELPSGDDIFSASAQNRLSRIAAGRFQGDKVEQKMLKELEQIKKEIRDLKNNSKPVKPVNL